MCIFREWEQTSTRTIPEDKPLTVYKVLQLKRGRFYSPMRHNVWRENEYHVKHVDGAFGDYRWDDPRYRNWCPGIHCLKTVKDCEEWAPGADFVIVKMEVWGTVKRYTDTYRWHDDSVRKGLLVQHARVVGIVQSPVFHDSYYWTKSTQEERFERRLQKFFADHPKVKDLRRRKKVA